jgi:hypothetical protein
LSRFVPHCTTVPADDEESGKLDEEPEDAEAQSFDVTMRRQPVQVEDGSPDDPIASLGKAIVADLASGSRVPALHLDPNLVSMYGTPSRSEAPVAAAVPVSELGGPYLSPVKPSRCLHTLYCHGFALVPFEETCERLMMMLVQ